MRKRGVNVLLCRPAEDATHRISGTVESLLSTGAPRSSWGTVMVHSGAVDGGTSTNQDTVMVHGTNPWKGGRASQGHSSVRPHPVCHDAELGARY